MMSADYTNCLVALNADALKLAESTKVLEGAAAARGQLGRLMKARELAEAAAVEMGELLATQDALSVMGWMRDGGMFAGAAHA